MARAITRLVKALALTQAGWLTLAAVVTSLGIGWWLNWPELITFGTGCALLLLLAVPFVITRAEMTLTRTVAKTRVAVGEADSVKIEATHSGRTRGRRRVVDEAINGQHFPIDIPALAPGESTASIYQLPTERRGVITVGPARVSKGDPLGLFNRSIGQTGIDQVWVHPRVKALGPFAAGYAKDLEGPTHDTSPAGDVAFHTIREYEPGDDHRHVHWMSTARKGQLMVRHYVDNRRPHNVVVVDDDIESMTPEQYDVALDIAASFTVSALRDTRPAGLYLGDREVIGATVPQTTDGVLDALCEADQHEDRDLGDSLTRVSQAESSASVLVLVTGPRSAAESLALVERTRRRIKTILVRVVEDGDEIALPKTRVFNVADLDAFVGQWRAGVS